jgi:hypothetical protein
MSYRIVYDHVAVRFPAEDLRRHLVDYGFHADQFMLFELGGDNNLYTGRTGNTRVRSWSMIGIGQDWEVMRGIVGFAASCEGGGMRFSGAGSTQAETYIRKCRNILASCLTPDGIGVAGMACSVALAVQPDGVPDWTRRQIDCLSTLLSPAESDGALVWKLYPFHEPLHAALLFAFRHLDKTPVYNMATVSGREYDRVPVLRRVPPSYVAPRERA